MKNEISHIKDDVKDIKDMLAEHVTWETKKYDEIKDDFAAKWVEKAIIAVATSVVASVIIAIIVLLPKG